jgi:small subunit ribosomal protein S4
LKPKSRELPLVKSAQEQTGREVPEYLSLSEPGSEGALLSLPNMDQIPLPLPINIPLVCEFIAHMH